MCDARSSCRVGLFGSPVKAETIVRLGDRIPRGSEGALWLEDGGKMPQAGVGGENRKYSHFPRILQTLLESTTEGAVPLAS